MSEATKAKEMDMLNGKLAGKLILFAIPLAFFSSYLIPQMWQWLADLREAMR